MSKMKPEVRPNGDGEVHTHPAFGQVVLTRWNAHPGLRLYGSELSHSTGVQLDIYRSENVRRLHQDWHHPRETLVSIRMSPVQFAELVASMGQGAGIPCTLDHYRDQTGQMVSPPVIDAPEMPRDRQHLDELRKTLQSKLEGMQAALNELEECIDSGRMSKRTIGAVSDKLHHLVRSLPDTVGYALESFTEHAENVGGRARAEFEAHVQRRMHQLGIDVVRPSEVPQLPE